MSVATITSVPGARPVVELGVGNTNTPSGQAVWDTARWDTVGDKWAGSEPTWLDITCDVHDVEIDAGRDRTISRWQVGTASITIDNTSGTYDVNVAPISPAVLSVRPGRQIRVGMSIDGAAPSWLGRWWIDAANPTYDPVLHDVVELSCVDAKGQAGKVDVAKLADPGVGASETVTARINRVLDAANWQGPYRDVAPGTTTLLATTLGAKAVDLLDVSADSAGGAVFGDWRGQVVYRGRDWQTYEPDIPVDDTIGNLPPDPGDDIVWTEPAVPAPPSDDVLLESCDNFTAAPWTRAGATAVTAGGQTGNGFVFTASLSDTAIYNLAAADQTGTLTVGFHVKFTTLPAGNSSFAKFSSDTGATLHSNVQVDNSGRLYVTRSTSTIIVQSAAGVVAAGTWYFIEVSLKLGDSPNGAVTLRLNGSTLVTAPATDTKNGGTKTVYDRFTLTGGGGLPWTADNVYIRKDTTFHGPITIPPGPPAPPAGGGETVDVVWSGDQLVWMGGTVADAVCPSGWEMSFEASDMATRVLVGRPSEAPHVFDDVTAQTLYGLETFSRTDLIPAVAAELDVIGARYLRVLSADFMPNIAAVTIDAATSTAARDLCATVDPTLPSRYRGYLREGGRVVFDRQFFAVGVSHRIDPESWTVRVALDDAGPFAVVGNRWDDAAWNTGIWADPPARATPLPALIGASNG